MKIALVFCHVDKIYEDCPAGVFSIFESNPPLGLCAIGTVAKLKCNEVKVFDQLLHHYSLTDLLRVIESYKPDMVGFSCTSLNIETSLTCAKKLKSDIDCIVFAGGIHVTLCTQQVMAAGVFDFLLSGEGEEIFDLALSAIDKSGLAGLNSVKCKGIWTKNGTGDNGVAVLSEIDQPTIDRSILEINMYRNKGALLDETPCYSLFSSRGCPFACKFCSKPAYFKNYRQRQIEKVCDEIRELVDNYGAKAISFREDNFTVDTARLKLFCEKMINEFGGQLPWECESRAELPYEILQLMYTAGCRGIWCGVETIVPKWSKWINKGLTEKKVVKFYANCERIGIKTGALFMFGFPDQTEEELLEDINFALNLHTVFSAFQCMAIFPGSPLASYYANHPELCHNITANVSLALTKGYTYRDMINREREINLRIKSNRVL